MSDGPTIITKRDARAAGIRHYFTGQPCKRGHLRERFVSTGQCIDCCSLYGVAWRRKNGVPARINISDARTEAMAHGFERFFTGVACHRNHLSDRYTKTGKCVACNLERIARYQKGNRGSIRQKQREYHHANKQERQRKHKAWREANREKFDEYQRSYRETNRERLRIKDRAAYRANEEQRKADKHRRRAVEGSYTPEDIKRIFEAQKGRCAYCRKSIKKSYHVDHVRPVSKGGTSWPSNLQLTCSGCNLSKKDALPEDFARRRGLLV